MDAIEAATEAFLRSDQDEFSVHDVVVYKPAIRAAIAAYLAETGVERDAERYRHFRRQFGLAVWGGDGQIAWHEEEIDKIIDSDILDAKAARGGEHG